MNFEIQSEKITEQQKNIYCYYFEIHVIFIFYALRFIVYVLASNKIFKFYLLVIICFALLSDVLVFGLTKNHNRYMKT